MFKDLPSLGVETLIGVYSSKCVLSLDVVEIDFHIVATATSVNVWNNHLLYILIWSSDYMTVCMFWLVF